MGNHEIISAELAAHQGEIVIYGTRLYRLIRFQDKLEDDYYYEAINVQGRLRLLSCVGGCIWLKDVLPCGDYDRIDNIFKINKEFIDKLPKSK